MRRGDEKVWRGKYDGAFAPHRDAKHRFSAPSALFQLVEMAVEIGNMVNALPPFAEQFMQ